MGFIKHGKFKSILMTLILLVGSLTTVSNAVLADEAPVLTAGSVSGNAGATVTVPVTLTSSGEVTAMQFDFSFDASQLSYTNTTRGALISGLNEDDEYIYTYDKNLISGNTVRVVIYSGTNTPIPSGSGIVVNLKFTVVAPVQGGQTSPLELSGVILADADGHAITTTVNNGQFTVPLVNYTISFEENGGSDVTDITRLPVLR
jgi:hypothetical protein